MELTKITLGCDPEIFVATKDGEVVSGIGLLGGTKNEPLPISNEGHCIQEDNVAWEFNIPPCETADEYVKHIQFVLAHLTARADEYGLVISPLASYELDSKYLKTRKSRQFGCEPDFNVYTQDKNPRPDKNTNLRVCGGHTHIGYPNPSVKTTMMIVKLFDIFLTAPAVLKDPDTRRRELYGKPGSHRMPKFGVECRQLSNFWIHSEENIRWVFDNTKFITLLAVEQPQSALELIDKYSKIAVDIINNNDKEGASKLVEELEIYKKV